MSHLRHRTVLAGLVHVSLALGQLKTAWETFKSKTVAEVSLKK